MELYRTCSVETAFVDEATVCKPAFCDNDLVMCKYVEDKLMGGKLQDGCQLYGNIIQKSFVITKSSLTEERLKLLQNPFGRKGKILLRANYPV